MLYGQDYVFTSPIAFGGAMIKHQDDPSQRSIDLITLKLAVYNRFGFCLSRIKTLFKLAW